MTDGYCEPCGECARCERNHAWRDKANLRAVELRNAIRMINLLAGCVSAELHAAGADEVRQHATLRAHKRALDRARRFVARQRK